MLSGWSGGCSWDESMTSSAKRRVEVFLAVAPVFRKGHTTRNPLPERWTATWVTRGTTTDLYTSKTCDTREEAEKLANRWLGRQNQQMAGAAFVDTTSRSAS
jgi:hypothetical protein